jgi:hypothetical protein
MRRLVHSVLLGLSVQGVVLPLLFIRPWIHVPSISDYVIAPGLITVALFDPCSVSCEEYQAYVIKALVVGLMLNVMVYSFIAYRLLKWRQNKAPRLP